MSYDYIKDAYCLHMIIYWFYSLLFYVVDLFYLDSNHRNWKKYKDAVIVSLCNQVFVTLPALYLLNDKINYAIDSSANDTFFVTICKIFLIGNLSNLIFYVSHYLLHTKKLYELIHYKHHEFIETVVVAAFYAHPIEHLVCNLLSFVIPFIFFGTNYLAAMVMIFVGTFITLSAHCEYIFFNIRNDHVIHHKLFVYNYGFGGYLDKFLGTYKSPVSLDAKAKE